jgi:hypothetical protein
MCRWTAKRNDAARIPHALGIDQVDLVGNDMRWRQSRRSSRRRIVARAHLTPTDCDVHDNWPPPRFKPFLEMAAAGGLRGTLDAMARRQDIYRSPPGARTGVRAPRRLANETIEAYLRPLVRTEQRTRDFQRFLAAFDCTHNRGGRGRPCAN